MSNIVTRIVSKACWRLPAWGMGALAVSLAALPLYNSCLAAVNTAPQIAAPRTGFIPQPLAFEPLPQSDTATSTEFVAHGSGYAVRVTPTGAIFRSRTAPVGKVVAGDPVSDIVMRLVAGNAAATGSGRAPLDRRTRYYIGDRPSAWRPDVPNYNRVAYHAVYPGVDVEYYGAQGGHMEFDFKIAPGADPGHIRLAFAGMSNPLRLDTAGNLVLTTAHGELRLNKPVAYQTLDHDKTADKPGTRVAVSAAFELLSPATVSIALGDYDPARPLVIDPEILYAGYLGGSGNDAGRALAMDSSGNRYIAGSTLSQDFPPGNHQLPTLTTPAEAKADAFVTKLAPDGTPLYTTFLGSFGTDTAVAIAVDAAGKAYITGDTDSGSLPPIGIPLQQAYGGAQDAFVARLGSDGTLEYISYLGGSDLDTALTITLDGVGNIYVGGSTVSDDFPPMTDPPVDPLNPVCALQCTRAQQAPGETRLGDGFIVKISADFSSYIYASYLGGNGAENVWTIAVDSNDQAYLGGTTTSFNFPLSTSGSGFQQFFGGGAADGFVVKLNDQGNAILYSTYLGGGGFDRVLGLAIDVDGNAYVTGATNSNLLTNTPTFPTKLGLMPFGGGDFDVFVTKLNAAGDDLIYSTYLGGNGSDESAAIVLNNQNEAIVVGTTDSSNFPLVQALQLQQLGDSDGFIAKISEGKDLAGDTVSLSLDFASYLGGTGADSLNAVVVNGTLIDVVGTSDSTDLPFVTPPLGTPLQAANAGGQDAFLFSLDIDPAIVVDLDVTMTSSPVPVPQNGTLQYTVIVSNLSQVDATGVTLLNSLVNAVFSSTSGADCDVSGDGVTAICHVGDIPAGSSSTLEVKADPVEIAQAVNTAALIRANQTDAEAQNNQDTVATTIVDNSGEKIGIAWVLVILGLFGLALRRVAGKYNL